MLLEVEVKAYADDLSSLKMKLLDSGAESVSNNLEIDRYFSHPSRDFGTTDEALRLRMVMKAEGGTDTIGSQGAEPLRCELSYKGPKIDLESKSREEYTVQIKDLSSAELILNKLGFKLVKEVRKNRELFKFNEYTVCLDMVEKLGTFVEIEKIIPSIEDLEDTRKEIQVLFKELLGLTRFERLSYLEMLLDIK